MSIEDLSAGQINDNIRRYRERGVPTGGFYSLATLLAEQQRRKSRKAVPVVQCARSIIELSRASPTGLTTYLDLWQTFFPGEPWKGNHSLRIVGDALDDVGFYCVAHGLPLIVTLVVNKAKASLSERARETIYQTWRERGVATQADRDAWLAEQQHRSLAISLESLTSVK